MNKRTGYFGMSETSEFLKWSYTELVENCFGKLVVSIGKGKFNEEFSLVAKMIAAWAIYNDQGKY